MLAYAWDNLDLTGKANREILKAMSADDLRRASRDESRFIEAVHLALARDYTGAAGQFQRYYDSGGKSAKPDRAVLLGRALELAGKPAEAEKVFASAGDHPAALMFLGMFDGKQMNMAKGRLVFAGAYRGFLMSDLAASLDANRLQFGAALNRWGLLSEARNEMESCVRQARTRADDYGGLRCRQLLAVIAIEQDRSDRDLAATQNDLEQVVSDAGRLGFQLLLGRAHLSLGQVFVQRGDYAAADRNFRAAMTLAESEESLRLQAQIDYASADAHNRSGQPAEAEREARRALAFYDSDHAAKEAAWCAIVLGRALKNLGRFDEALAVLNRRSTMTPPVAREDRIVLRHTIGTVYAAAENHPAALREYRNALELGLTGDPAPYLLSIAEAEAEMGDLPGARRKLEDLARRKGLPGLYRTDLRRNTARVELYAGTPAAAVRVLERSVPAQSEDGDDKVLLGIAKIRTGKTVEGISLCRGALGAGRYARTGSASRLCLLEGLARAKDLAGARLIYDSIGKNWTPRVESAWRADALMSTLEPSNAQLRQAATAHLDDLRRLWSDEVFLRYTSRRDVRNQMSAAKLMSRRQ